MVSTREKGQAVEQWVKRYLIAQGYEPIVDNYCCPQGEIDLIMQHEQQLVFIEVRARKQTQHYVSALESVTLKKQQKIIRTAQWFLSEYPQYQTWVCRFDVAAVQLPNYQLEYIKHAFTC